MEQKEYKAFKKRLETVRFKEGQKTLCLELLENAKQNYDDFAQFIAYVYLLDYAVALRDYKACKEYMFKALSYSSETCKEERSQLYQLCGVYSFLIGDYHTAIDYYTKTLHICEEIRQEDRIAAIYNNIALIFDQCQDYQRALDYYLKSYELMQHNDHPFHKRNISIIIGNIVSCYAWLQDVEHARFYYEKSLECGIFAHINICLKATIAYVEKDNEKTLQYIKDADVLMHTQKIDKNLTYSVYEDFVRILLDIGNEKQILHGLKSFADVSNAGNIAENIIILRYYIEFAKKFQKDELLHNLYCLYYEMQEEQEKENHMQQAITCADQILLDKMISMNRYLSTSAILDSGTGLKNRNAFEHDVSLLLDNSEVTRLTLLMCDVDNFKQHNDAYGHLYGDEILRTLGNFLQELGDDGIIPYRYGGDEFLCLAVNKSKDEIENYIKNIYACLLDHSEIKISIGFTSMTRKDITNGTDLIMRADKALYQAKANGKNHYEYYE